MSKTPNLPQISHDLRNYISGISGLADLISQNISSCYKKQAMFDRSFNKDLIEAQKMAKMLEDYSIEAMGFVDDMLDISMAEAGSFSLGEIKECDVASVIARLLVFNKSFIIGHKVIVKTEIADNLPLLKCDERRLKQVLTNLITNAVKYSFESGEVLIRINEASHDLSLPKIRIEIIDSGIGMAEAEIAMAFSGDGAQIDKSDLNKNIPLDSHGLGMPIVKQLMELMKGEMRIESVKGKGTKVILEF